MQTSGRTAVRLGVCMLLLLLAASPVHSAASRSLKNFLWTEEEAPEPAVETPPTAADEVAEGSDDPGAEGPPLEFHKSPEESPSLASSPSPSPVETSVPEPSPSPPELSPTLPG
ncbi:hypothetical protein ACKKBG_A07590 [Auxenochlorella protothecoides x Auxenochlorella symbiontica]